MRNIEVEILDVLYCFAPISCREIADMLSLSYSKVYYRLNYIYDDMVQRSIIENKVFYELH